MLANEDRSDPLKANYNEDNVLINATKDIQGEINDGVDYANTYVALGDETRDKVEVIIEVKAAAEFEGATEVGDSGRLGGQLLHAPDTSELFVGLILRNRQPRCPAIPTSVVVVGHRGGGRRCRMLLVSVVVVVLRHVYVLSCAVEREKIARSDLCVCVR